MVPRQMNAHVQRLPQVEKDGRAHVLPPLRYGTVSFSHSVPVER
jgi:hypothetical protein